MDGRFGRTVDGVETDGDEGKARGRKQDVGRLLERNEVWKKQASKDHGRCDVRSDLFDDGGIGGGGWIGELE